MISTAHRCQQAVVQVQGARWQPLRERLSQPRHAAADAQRAAMQLGHRHHLRRTLRIVQQQHLAIVVLREAGQAEFRDETGDAWLRERPEPGWTEIEIFSDRQHPAADTRTRLEHGNLGTGWLQQIGEPQSAQAGADDRDIQQRRAGGGG